MAKRRKIVGAFHGTGAEIFDKFNTSGFARNNAIFSIGSHFGTYKAANEIFKSYPSLNKKRIIKALLDLKNPIELSDNFGGYVGILPMMEEILLKNALSKKAASKYSRLNKFYDSLKSRVENHRDLNSTTVKNANKAIKDALIELGYDSIIYKNKAEDSGSESYVAFHPEQIKILSQDSSSDFSDAEKKHIRKLSSIRKSNPVSKILGIRRQKHPTRKYFEDMFTNKETGEVDYEKVELYFGEAANAYAKKSFYGTRGNSDPLDYMNGPKKNWVGYDPSSSPIGDLFRRLAAEEDLIRSTNNRKEWSRAHRNFVRKYKRLSDREREVLDRTVEYGGGVEGRRMAEEDIANERSDKAKSLRRRRRLDAAKREQKANEAYRYDMMDEFDQKMHDLTERYGGDAGKADASLRNTLKKELGSFFKNSRMSTKDLHDLAKNFREIEQLPIIGGLAKLATNPMGLTAAGVFALRDIIKDQDESIENVIKWRSKANYYGKASKRQQLALLSAGVDIGNIDEVYGSKLAMLTKWKYGVGLDALGEMTVFSSGDPRINDMINAGFSGDYDTYMKIGHDIAKSLPDGDRTNFLDAAKISISEYTAQEELVNPTHEGRVRKWKSLIKKRLDERASNSIFGAIDKWFYLISTLGIGPSYDARVLAIDEEYGTLSISSPLRSIMRDDIEAVQKTMDAAKSYDIYQQSRAANPSYYDYVTNNNGRTTTIHIDTAEFNGIQNVGEFGREMEKTADKVEGFHATAEANDPKVF